MSPNHWSLRFAQILMMRVAVSLILCSDVQNLKEGLVGYEIMRGMLNIYIYILLYLKK